MGVVGGRRLGRSRNGGEGWAVGVWWCLGGRHGSAVRHPSLLNEGNVMMGIRQRVLQTHGPMLSSSRYVTCKHAPGSNWITHPTITSNSLQKSSSFQPRS
jgi:hypothetical protein